MAAQTFDRLPRRSLGFLPTPLIELKQLSRDLKGPLILMKRDDQTGLALGGNKTRKLEYLVGEALGQGCDTLVTGGAGQSNHCRQTAAAAAACGLACHLVLGGEPPASPNGNLLLDDLLGATIHWSGAQRKGERIPEIAARLGEAGRKPYIVPYGGSNRTGAVGFVAATAELRKQLHASGLSVSRIVFASSSGGTQAGLLVGRRLFDETFDLIGIGIDKGEAGEKPYTQHVADLANETAELLGVASGFTATEVVVRNEFLGAGYGIIGPPERRAIRVVAEKEGILLDPVYTGRAMAALLSMIERREFTRDETILFWHTGGTPAVFSCAEELTSA
jgi:D-cysteine desulfhydrase